MRKPDDEHQVTLTFMFTDNMPLIVEGVIGWEYRPAHQHDDGTGRDDGTGHPAEWIVHEWLPPAPPPAINKRRHQIMHDKLKYVTVSIENVDKVLWDTDQHEPDDEMVDAIKYLAQQTSTEGAQAQHSPTDKDNNQ